LVKAQGQLRVVHLPLYVCILQWLSRVILLVDMGKLLFPM